MPSPSIVDDLYTLPFFPIMPDYNEFERREIQRQADVARDIASHGKIQQKDLRSDDELLRNGVSFFGLIPKVRRSGIFLCNHSWESHRGKVNIPQRY